MSETTNSLTLYPSINAYAAFIKDKVLQSLSVVIILAENIAVDRI